MTMVSGVSSIECSQRSTPLFHVKQGISVISLNDRRGTPRFYVNLKGIDHDLIESEHADEESATARAKYISSRRKTREDVIALIATIERFKKMEQ